jgi:molybdopterin-guanine dinucleotide biosynthesis protein B
MLGPAGVPVIAVVGSRHSGKTATVEAIVRELTGRGYRVATAKHIHDPDFTLDTEGRDTWRHTKAGACVTIAVAAKELATIRKVNTAELSLNDITKDCEENIDVIVTEGFRGLLAQDLTVPKVVTIKNKNEIDEATQAFKPILAFAGEIHGAEKYKSKIPILNIAKESGKLTEIIGKRIAPIIAKRRETTESTSIEINGKALPLNPYVQKVTRNVIIGILSTLKGAEITGNENIKIEVTKPNE